MGTVFSDWGSYIGLLDQMWGKAGAWRSAQSFEQLAEQIRSASPELVGGDAASTVGEHGFAALAEALAENYGDNETVAARIRFAALCRPAAEHGLPAEWAGYFVAEDEGGTLVFSPERFAEPGTWQPVDAQQPQGSAGTRSALARDEDSGLLYDAEHWYLEDGATVVQPDTDNPGYAHDAAGHLYHLGKPADPATTLFDRESGRWRRGTGSGDYEYHHDQDQVWERHGEQGLWLRLHEGTGRWLPYDAPSQTWLSEGRWLSGDRIGTPRSGASDVGRPQREEALRAAIVQVRTAGFGPDEVPDTEIEKVFDQRIRELQGEAR